jgi:hypothetical protein
MVEEERKKGALENRQRLRKNFQSKLKTSGGALIL